MQHLNMNLDDIKHHVLNAARASFLPETERAALITRLKTEMTKAGVLVRSICFLRPRKSRWPRYLKGYDRDRLAAGVLLHI
jgi:hypothetical protein